MRWRGGGVTWRPRHYFYCLRDIEHVIWFCRTLIEPDQGPSKTSASWVGLVREAAEASLEFLGPFALLGGAGPQRGASTTGATASAHADVDLTAIKRRANMDFSRAGSTGLLLSGPLVIAA